MDISTRVQQILMARNRAQAKAGDSLVSAKVLPAVLGLILAYLSSDPMVRESLTALPVQIVIGLTMAAMVGGYLHHSLDDHGGSLNESLDTPHRDRQFCPDDLPDPGMGAQHPTGRLAETLISR